MTTGVITRVPFPSDSLIGQLGRQRESNLWIPSSFDYDVFEDKFWGDALLTEYPAAKTNGVSAAVTFTEHNANGYLDFISGTADNGYAGQGMGLQFTGDRGVLGEFIIKTPATITTMKIEVGFSDADDDAGAINVKATPSFTATDCAVFVVDTDHDANIAFITAKGGSGTATQDIQALAASTTYRLGVRIEGDTVSGWIDGNQGDSGHHRRRQRPDAVDVRAGKSGICFQDDAAAQVAGYTACVLERREEGERNGICSETHRGPCGRRCNQRGCPSKPGWGTGRNPLA